MKKLPSGVSNYEELIMDNYYYVDKTMYIEKLEKYPNKRVMFLRPRKFGKTLFTSTLENYYDVKKTDKFETLFGDKYIGKNPTKLKNSYYILKFNFSGIDTSSTEATIKAFKNEVASAIEFFARKYELDFYVNMESDAESILNNLFVAFNLQKEEQKIYVIIDEYDHFANELLGFNVGGFKELVSKNGKVRKWYEILKKGTESIVDRIFITGVAPITLDGLTSGFNIVSNITRDLGFSEMMGFTKEELEDIMKSQGISEEKIGELLPIMKINYDGYKFSLKSEKKLYNSNMSLYFLNEYIMHNEYPEKMVDVNVISDYEKIGRMLKLCKGEKRIQILENAVSGDGIINEIVDKFNPAEEFGDKEMVSMLYYLGYLTIGENIGNFAKLVIPNNIMKEIYSDYFLKVTREELGLDFSANYANLALEILTEGKIDKTVNLLRDYLNGLSNRDYQKFDEKYVKLLFYAIAKNFNTAYIIKSEMEVQRKYPDILLIPKDFEKNYFAVMIEFKYLKKGEEKQLEEKQAEAKKQLLEYAEFDEIKNIKKLNKYTVIAVVDKVYVEKIN